MAPENKRKRPAADSAKPAKAAKSAPADAPNKKPRTTTVQADAPAPPQPSLLKKEETSFPRGGQHALTPLEYKEVANEAARDVLFEASGAAAGGDESKPAHKKKHVRKDKKPKNGKKTAAAEEKETGPKVEGISYKRLVPGTIVLGCVEKINKTDIALSLPNNLTGYIPITQISTKITEKLEELTKNAENSESEDDDEDEEEDDLELSELFRVGQYLRAQVVQRHEDDEPEKKKKGGKPKKHIELAIVPSLANAGLTASDLKTGVTVQASVASVEDHGLVMDLGLEGDVKGFLSSKELGPHFTIATAKEGQTFLTTVTGLSSNGKIVKLSADLEQKFSKKGKLAGGKAAWWLTDAPTIDAFLPGTGVEILVTDVGKQGGIVGTIMGSLDAVADYFHVAGWEKEDLESRVKPGSKIKARITTTFPNSDPRKVGFSILPHILSFTAPAETDPLTALPIGTIINTAKVVGVESRVGLFVDVGVEGVPGFVHISRISSEEKITELLKDDGAYKIGSVHQARILGFNPMDGLYIVSTEKRVIEQPFLRIDDIKVGQVVKGKVERILDRGGLVITVSDGISGLVEEQHVSDVKLKNPEKKFREGTEVRARVLATNPARRKLFLTLKKTMVNSDAPIIDSYEVEAGTQSVGTLVNIMDNGAVVRFYSGVSAWLPVSEMSEAYIQNPKDHFRVGQSVNVNVLSADPENRKMRVSCKDPSAFGEAQQQALHNLKPGQIVSGKVSEKTDDELILELSDVGADGLKGILVIGHLTDGSREKNMNTMRKLRAGQTLSDLAVLDKNENRRIIYLTMKPSLVKAAKDGSAIDSFSKVTEGAVVKGFIKNTADVGAFISFFGGVTGLALRNALPNEVQSLPGFGYHRLQSVTATVFAVNRDEQKFLVSLKPEDQVAKKNSDAPVDPKVVTNPVDGKAKNIDDFVPGTLTKARIVSIQETQINVQLADNVQGRIDVSQIYDSYDDIKNKKVPLEGYKKGTILDVRVIGIHDARNHRFLAITHRTSNKKAPIFELSAKPQDVKNENYEVLTLDKVTVGSNWLAFVNNITPDCVWVNISPDIRGRIRILDLSDDVAQLRDVERHFPVGSVLKCNVINVDSAHGKLDLSGRSTSVSKLNLDTLTKGMVVPGRVTKVLERQLLVQLSDSVAGIVNLTDLADDFSQAKVSNYEKNQIVRVCVLDVDKPNKRVTLSTRPSRVLSASLPIKDPEVTSIHEIKERELRRGFVKNISDKGLFVTLGPNVTAWVKVSDLSDGFLKEWKSKFTIDQVVEGRIINVDAPLGHVQMSLRPSAVTGKAERQTGLSDFKKGQIVTGKVTKVAEYGVFVAIDNSNVSGLCHKSQIADRKVEDISALYVEGDPVKAIILDIDLEKRRISFGLKASYFADKPEDKDNEDGMDVDEEESSDDEGGVDLSHVREMSESESESEDDSEDDSDVEMDDAPAPTISGGLSAGGFDFTGASLFEKRPAAADSDDDSDDEATKKRSKKRKTNTIQQDLTGDMVSREPQSATDFERVLLGDPNDSRLWIQYMAFQLQLSELDKAREIAERALKTISQREDAEKKNIWIAMLNMENSYGDDESLEETFKRATQYMDSKDMHDRLASIYIQSGKSDKADALFKTMIKKFSQHPDVWLNYSDFLLSTQQNRPAAREMLKRALQALPQDLHRDLIIKFASLEFRTGDPERGRTLFENLIGAYAKRMDIWNVLVDMEIKYGEKENVREAFRRALKEEKLKPKQASALCRKWKEYEEKQGDAKGVKEVAERARAFVEAAKKKA